jgi:hypothetical protein
MDIELGRITQPRISRQIDYYLPTSPWLRFPSRPRAFFFLAAIRRRIRGESQAAFLPRPQT